jgi:hypothetical protein
VRLQPLTRSVSTVLGAAGGGTVSTGPQVTNEMWNVTVASVSCSTNGSEATCRIYAGGYISQGAFIDGTTWGSTGDSTTNFATPVYTGQQVFAAWTGGDPGAIATLVVQGTRQVP